MTPKEIQAQLRRIRDDIGKDARVSVYLSYDNLTSSTHPAVAATIYPNGIGGHGALRVQADTWDELFTKLTEGWAEASARYKAERVREMALAIIRITAEQGHCTDASLRAADFSGEEVKRYSEEACRDADEIASNGPFSVVSLRGANAA